MTAREVLLRAAEAYDGRRGLCGTIDDAARLCGGALDDKLDAICKLRVHLGVESALEWFYAPGRTTAEVIAALRGAAGAAP